MTRIKVTLSVPRSSVCYQKYQGSKVQVPGLTMNMNMSITMTMINPTVQHGYPVITDISKNGIRDACSTKRTCCANKRTCGANNGPLMLFLILFPHKLSDWNQRPCATLGEVWKSNCLTPD